MSENRTGFIARAYQDRSETKESDESYEQPDVKAAGLKLTWVALETIPPRRLPRYEFRDPDAILSKPEVLGLINRLATEKSNSDRWLFDLQNLIHTAFSGPIPDYILTSPNAKYEYLDRLRRSAWSSLNSGDALRRFPRPSLTAAVLTVAAYAAKYLPLIGTAHADERASLLAGVSQPVLTGIVIGFASLLGILVLGLFYAGYIAKPKNQTAANVVSHLVTGIAGSLLGVKL